MCLIIDANKINDFVNKPDDPDHRPIYDWLEKQNGRIATGGLNYNELTMSKSGKRFVITLLRAGRALRYDDNKILREERKLSGSPNVTSNDEHVLALTIVSGARVLYSSDEALCTDFKNGKIIPPRRKHRGKIYRNRQHRDLLKDSPPCLIP